MRHYEVVYLIHQDHVDEVENVNTKVQGTNSSLIIILLNMFILIDRRSMVSKV